MRIRDVGLCLLGGAIVYTTVVACSGDAGDTAPVPSASADPSGGTRLKPVYREAEDGSREPVNGLWFDAQRNEECSFAISADGKMRCLPQGVGFNYFGDAACATSIVILPGSCSAPAYATSTGSSTACAVAQMHVFAVGDAATPANIYAKNGTSCVSLGPAGSDTFTYFTVGAEVPASSFVAATYSH